jgi:hypothetical protein
MILAFLWLSGEALSARLHSQTVCAVAAGQRQHSNNPTVPFTLLTAGRMLLRSTTPVAICSCAPPLKGVL